MAKTRKVSRKAIYYIIQYEKLRFSLPLLRCLNLNKANYIIKEIHQEVCGNHSEAISMVFDIVVQVYYLPTIDHDIKKFAKKCD